MTRDCNREIDLHSKFFQKRIVLQLVCCTTKFKLNKPDLAALRAQLRCEEFQTFAKASCTDLEPETAADLRSLR